MTKNQIQEELNNYKEYQDKVWKDRYAVEGETSKYETYMRVAKAIAENEKPEEQEYYKSQYYDILSKELFIPGGRVLSGAGLGDKVTLINCFVEPVEDSLESIFTAVYRMARTMKLGGGVGLDFTSLRPSGASTSSRGVSCGPIKFMDIFSATTNTIIQGGSRRGALMCTLGIEHPDIMEFIDAKNDHDRLNGCNISIKTTDEFLESVNKKKKFSLSFNGKNEKKVNAVDLFTKIVYSNWKSAEPGFLYWDTIKKESNTEEFAKVISLNPCGEIPLENYGCCDLGSLNLSNFITDSKKFDYELLNKTVPIAVRFLDSVLDISHFPFEEQRIVAQKSRRIGLGIMGLADALIKMELKYGSTEACNEIQDIFVIIRQLTYQASIDLSKEKGPAEGALINAINWQTNSDRISGFINRLPDNLKNEVLSGNIRNCALLTSAPTGTSSTLAGVSNGIEPLFSYRVQRKDRIGEHNYMVPIVAEYMLENNIVSLKKLPEYFITAPDINPMDRVILQGTIQKYIDNAISSTVNLPEEATPKTIAEIYMRAWKEGLKGITVFRDKSRKGVLNTVK